MIVGRSEPRYSEVCIQAETPEPEIVRALEAFSDLPDGSVGRAFLDFHERNNLDMPGLLPSTVNHLYVAHDFIHVISEIEPTGPGEIALGGFQLAMDENPVPLTCWVSRLRADGTPPATSRSSITLR